MPGAVETALLELGVFFEPLANAIDDPNDLAALLRRLGLNFDGPELAAAAGALGPMASGVRNLITLTAAAVEGGLDEAELASIAAAAKPVVEGLAAIGDAFEGVVPGGGGPPASPQTLAELPLDLLDLLLADYLTRRAPAALHVLVLLDVHAVEPIPATGAPRSRGRAYARTLFRWGRIRRLFSDPESWAREAYGWGVDFDSDLAIMRLCRLFAMLGGTAEVRDMTDAQVAELLPHLVDTIATPRYALAALVRRRTIAEDGAVDVAASGEFGIALLPCGGDGAQADSDAGLAFAPYMEGSVDTDVTLAPGVALRLDGAIGAVGGAIFKLRPSGLDLDTGVDAVAFTGSFGVELSVGPVDPGAKLIFFGEAGGTRIEADLVLAKVGGEASNAGPDFYLAAGIKGLAATIDPGDDGLLSAVLSGPIAISVGDLALGWRRGRGVYFEGGTSVGVTVPLELRIGPLGVHEIGLNLSFADPFTVTLRTTADLTIGPLFAMAEGMGVAASLVPAVDGVLGDRDIAFGFVSPTGYAVALTATPISGGGLLSVGDNEYRGALALKFATFGLSAFAILNTRMPDGGRGFSFAGSIFAEFNVPLGFGFFLTGVGGVVGINRTVNTDALRTVLFEGRLDNLLFPADPIQNARTILADMAAILPVREGTHLFGPVARIAWGTPTLIEAKLGVVVEVGPNLRILILGGLNMNLPTRDTALVAFNITFFGEIDFGAGTIGFDATLTNSRVLTWPVSGDAAVRTGWAPRLEHMMSVGGLHPLFPKPANLPDLRRVTINFGTNNPKITISGYSALTTNSLQFGARADLYAKGPKIRLVGQLAAEGWIYLDALVYFDPFAFDVKVGGGINLLRNGSVVAGLGFELRLRGPNTFKINGKVWVTVCGIDVDFGINHSWGSAQSLPTANVDPVAVLRLALEKAGGFEPIPPRGRTSGVGFARGDAVAAAVDPLGGVRLVQRAVPLGVRIEKIGEAQVAASAGLLDLRAFGTGGAPVVVGRAELDFVRGHFFRIPNSEKLRATAFERHKAGFEIAAEALTGPVGTAIVETYSYEIIEIPVDQEDPLALHGVGAQPAEFLARFARAHLRQTARPASGIRNEFPRADSVGLRPSVWVNETAAGAARDAMRSGTPIPVGGMIRPSLTEALQATRNAAAVFEPNPVVEDYVLAAEPA